MFSQEVDPKIDSLIATYLDANTLRPEVLFRHFLPTGYRQTTLDSVSAELLSAAIYAKVHLGMLITLYDDFADVLSLADVVVLADIYAAREKNTYGVSSRDILSKLRERGTECYYFPSFEEIEKFLLKNCVNGDLLITMGAGDIVNVGEHLLGK